MSASRIVSKLGGRWHGSYGMSLCPAHDDKNPSLSISETSEGRILWHCHAGCSQEAVEAMNCHIPHAEELLVRIKTQLDLKNREKELKNISAAKDRFFSILAHDLKSPFSSQLSLLASILDNYEKIKPEDHILYFKNLYESAGKGYHLL